MGLKKTFSIMEECGLDYNMLKKAILAHLDAVDLEDVIEDLKDELGLDDGDFED